MTTDRRAQIVDAALAVAQERGLGAMSMRAVAEHLGASVMALYRHIPTKEALLDEMVGRLLGEINLPNPAQPWQQRLHHLAGEVYDLAARYPTIVPLLLSRAYLTPNAVSVVQATSTILQDAGIPHDQVPRVERMVNTFLLGYATSAANQAFWSDPTATNPPPESPTPPVVTQTQTAAPNRWKKELDHDITDLIHLLAQRVSIGEGRPERSGLSR